CGSVYRETPIGAAGSTRRNGSIRRIAVALDVVMMSSACVSKSAYEQRQGQLDECKTDKTAAQDAASECEERFEREVSRWDDTDKALTEAVPQAMQQLQEEKEKILELVPEAARQEVRAYFEDFSK